MSETFEYANEIWLSPSAEYLVEVGNEWWSPSEVIVVSIRRYRRLRAKKRLITQGKHYGFAVAIPRSHGKSKGNDNHDED